MALDIQIVSDLHLEFVADKKSLVCFKPSAKVLALLGDICCVASDDDFERCDYRLLQEDALKHFSSIFVFFPHFQEICNSS